MAKKKIEQYNKNKIIVKVLSESMCSLLNVLDIIDLYRFKQSWRNQSTLVL